MASELPKRVLFGSPWWHSDIVNGVIRHAADRGWHVDLQTCLSGTLPNRWSGDGIVTQMAGEAVAHLKSVAGPRCPIVSLNNNAPDIDVPTVGPDTRLAGRVAAEHLLDRGFKSFAFYSRENSPAASTRCREFTRTIELAGHSAQAIQWTDRREVRGESWFDRQRWLGEHLDRLDKPLAVFAFNDEVAVEVIEACMARDLTIPDRVAVLGVLDMDIFRLSTTVALSSVAFDFDKITETACAVLGRIMDGQPPPDEPILFPPLGVVDRQSTNTLAAYSPVVAQAVRYMLDHHTEAELSIDPIVDASGVSRASLFNAFKAELNRTPGAVLLRIRLDRAKKMLTETDEKVYAVADACGFGKPVNLHRAFKQHLGVSPNEFRAAQADNPKA